MNSLDVIGKVLVKMDELIPFGTGLVTSSSINPIRDYIKESINTGWQSLASRAPAYLLPPTQIDDVTVLINSDLSISITSNTVFARPLSIKMKSWENDVNEFIPVNTRKHQEQKNKHSRGSIYKPAVVWISNSKLLAFSSLDTSDSLESFTGVTLLDIENIDLPEALVEALYYEIAGVVYNIMEQSKQAEIMFTSATNLLL